MMRALKLAACNDLDSKLVDGVRQSNVFDGDLIDIVRMQIQIYSRMHISNFWMMILLVSFACHHVQKVHGRVK